MPRNATAALDAVRRAAVPLAGADVDHDALLELVGDARFVLLGEATHGTSEFYATRARITRRLVEEKGFSAVAVEADWPDAYRVNRYARGAGRDSTAEEALGDFRRFPTWMWRNADVVDLVAWLRDHNDRLPGDRSRVGFYGLDLYSLHRSMEEVVAYLDRIDPRAAAEARRRYSCIDHAAEDGDGQSYGAATAFGAGPSCEDEAVAQLVELCHHAAEYAGRDGATADDDFFSAEQNARVVVDAERYYREMFRGRVSSWNLRDQHMADTLDDVASHLSRRSGRPAKVVVWAHNSHLGDARATELGEAGELNVGQLVRQRHGSDAVLVGFTTSTGTVTAADDWGGPPRRTAVRPPVRGSYEELFSQTGVAEFYLPLREGPAREALREPRLERAIGVVYRPRTERISHYFEARLADQFDAVYHFEETRAVEPLEREPGRPDAEVPETYPSGV